jgi:hypothetical protein
MSKAHGLGRVLWIDDRLRAIGRIDQQVMGLPYGFPKTNLSARRMFQNSGKEDLHLSRHKTASFSVSSAGAIDPI